MSEKLDDVLSGETMAEYLQRKEDEKFEREEELLDNLMSQIRGAKPKYKPEFIKIMLRHMGIEGKSYKSLAFVLGIKSTKTLYNWESKYPEWKAAKEVAESGRLNHIENTLQKLADGTYKGNAAAAIFYAKNACPDEFKDKREIGVSGGVTYVIDTGIPAKQLPHSNINEAIEAEFTEVIEDEDDSDLL